MLKKLSEHIQTEKLIFSKDELELMARLPGLLVEDITIKPDDNNNLSFRCMDPSHISLLDVSFQYALVSKFAFRTDDLENIIKSFNADDISLEISDKLILENSYERHELMQIESSDQNTPLPKIPYDAIFRMQIKEFYKVIKTLYKNQKYDYMTFLTGINGLKIKCINDFSNTEKLLIADRISSNDLENAATYSLEYIFPFIQVLNSNKLTKNLEIEIAYSNEKPLKLSVYQPIENMPKICFYLAPRVVN